MIALFLVWVIVPGPTYRITVDRAAGKVEWVTLKGGKEGSSDALAASDIASADMEFNRNARNIVIVRKDGSQSYPLGRQHFTGEPEQYVVLNAIRQLIGQAPSATQTH